MKVPVESFKVLDWNIKVPDKELECEGLMDGSFRIIFFSNHDLWREGCSQCDQPPTLDEPSIQMKKAIAD